MGVSPYSNQYFWISLDSLSTFCCNYLIISWFYSTNIIIIINLIKGKIWSNGDMRREWWWCSYLDEVLLPADPQSPHEVTAQHVRHGYGGLYLPSPQYLGLPILGTNVDPVGSCWVVLRLWQYHLPQHCYQLNIEFSTCAGAESTKTFSLQLLSLLNLYSIRYKDTVHSLYLWLTTFLI